MRRWRSRNKLKEFVMKSKCKVPLVRLFGIIAFVAVIEFSMMACDNGGGDDPNTDPKTLVITGVTSEDAATYFHYEPTGPFEAVGSILLYPPGTDPSTGNATQTAFSMNAYENIKVEGGTYTIPLMTPEWKEWKGTGTFDVWVWSDLKNNAPTHGAILRNVKFSEKVTTIAWSSFGEKW
jgi:hypothetical protein